MQLNLAGEQLDGPPRRSKSRGLAILHGRLLFASGRSFALNLALVRELFLRATLMNTQKLVAGRNQCGAVMGKWRGA